MKLQYVNIHGQPITQAAMDAQASIGKQQAAVRRKQTDPDKPAGYHKGWRVIGFSPEQVQAAREGRERVRKLALESGSSDIPPPFSLDKYLKTSKGRSARAKPFELHESAVQCKELAERAGWLGVEIIALAKGV